MSFRRLTIFMALMATLSVGAQRKQIGEARTYLKSGKNFDKAEKLMTDLLKDSANRENKRIYEIWWQSVQKQYEQANEKFYMKKQQDTAQFFSIVRRLFTISFRLDSLDARPDKKGKVSHDLRKDVARDMMGYRNNLFNGGAFYVRKGDFKKAFDYFETYINCRRQPLFTEYDFSQEPRMAEAAYWATYNGYRMEEPIMTLRYRDLALADTAKRSWTLQYVAESWKSLKDDSMYVATLWQGFNDYPMSNYFFPRLMDSYQNQPEEALKVADQALEADSTSRLFLFAKSVVLLKLEKFAESLDYSNRVIKRYPDMAEAYYNAGTAYLNIVLRMDPVRHKKLIKKMYQNAMPYMEKYRTLAPGGEEKWGPALYRIYFNLNMGKQFDEIDKILKKQKS
jgi:tetratricopeptide (TPR) repeat protein